MTLPVSAVDSVAQSHGSWDRTQSQPPKATLTLLFMEVSRVISQTRQEKSRRHGHTPAWSSKKGSHNPRITASKWMCGTEAPTPRCVQKPHLRGLGFVWLGKTSGTATSGPPVPAPHQPWKGNRMAGVSETLPGDPKQNRACRLAGNQYLIVSSVSQRGSWQRS